MHNLIYGFHSIISSIRAKPQSLETIYIDSKRQDKRAQELINLASLHKIKIKMASSSELSSLSSTDSHQGVIATIKTKTMPTLKDLINELEAKANATILVLDGITDPHNLGAIIRTADCFGVDAIILPKNNSANIDNPVVAKVSSGAINNISVITVNNISQTLDTLKQHQFWIAGTALDPIAVNLYEFKPSNKMVWVMGNEGTGIRRLVTEHCDYLVTIPMLGKTQSLNVSVATGIVLSYINFTQKS